ncbi:DNA-processing protein DprA [Chitinophaga lutea]
MYEELHFRMALTWIPQVGDVVARELLLRFGSAGAVFKAKGRELASTPGVGVQRVAAIRAFNNWKDIERELRFMERAGVRPLFYADDEYPARLRHCPDAPLMLYRRGPADLSAQRMLAVVGTRRPSEYGRTVCRELVAELAAQGVTIVSGMALGIDILAHRTALEHGLPTVGVLAHGLDMLYPPAHKATARQMMENGALLSDFPSGTALNRQHFPRRNRIVAGLCDATLVVETGTSGGSLITAELAAGYHRDVLAIPGRIGDPLSAGCLELVRRNKAALVTCAGDVLEALNWRELPVRRESAVQTSLFAALNDEQRAILRALEGNDALHVDEIQYQSGIAQQRIPELLLQLELDGHVQSRPGYYYRLTPPHLHANKSTRENELR